jgi:hypothetical protein
VYTKDELTALEAAHRAWHPQAERLETFCNEAAVMSGFDYASDVAIAGQDVTCKFVWRRGDDGDEVSWPLRLMMDGAAAVARHVQDAARLAADERIARQRAEVERDERRRYEALHKKYGGK